MEELRAVLGRRVREARKQQGKTIEALAAACSLSTNYVSELERGSRNPSVETVCRIAYALGTEASELLKGLAWHPGED